MIDPHKQETPEAKPAKRWLVAVGVSLWVSFMSAGVATAFFFSAFDPAVLAQLATYPMVMSRNAGYSLGFLLFWLLLIINSAVVIWLVTRDPNK